MPLFRCNLSLLAVLVSSSLASSQPWRVLSTRQTAFEIRGAVPDPSSPSRFFTWGTSLHLWENTKPKLLATAPLGFDAGGCAFDADSDGRTDLVLVLRSNDSPLGRLVLLRAPAFRPELIDTDVELRDCLPVTLYNRRGFLIVHRHTQIRFYQVPNQRGQPWPMREIYSIYTASRQSGLALADVNADGLPDIFCGNYWAQAPPEFELPWHIFAINTHHGSPEDASFAFAATPDTLYAAQKELAATPLRISRRPADPRQLWPETQASGPPLTHPSALLFHDGLLFAADGQGLRAYDPNGELKSQWPGPPIRKLFPTGDALIAAGAHFVSVWRK